MSSPRRRRRRLPDEVRAAAVRAVLCLAFTLVGVVIATLASYAGTWLITPALLAMGVGVFGTMWCLLEILISRQIAAQRMRGPNSAHPMAGSRAPAEPLAARPLPRPGGAPRQPYPGQGVYQGQGPYQAGQSGPTGQLPYRPQPPHQPQLPTA